MEVKNKVVLKEDEIKGEVTAFFPGGQSMTINANGEDYFKVSIQGHDIMMSRKTLELLFRVDEVNKKIIDKVFKKGVK